MLILGTTHPVARKEHQCGLCLRVIRPGEKYMRSRSIGDDGPYVWKECAHCSVLLRRLFAEAGNDWYDPDWGYGSDEVAEFDTDIAETKDLLTLWRRRWASPDGGLVPVPTDVTP